MKTKAMRYVWINPVVEAMAGADYPVVVRQIAARGYILVNCTGVLEKVREEYRRQLAEGSRKPLIDARCPVVTQRVEEHFPELSGNVAAILPILLSCAQKLYDQYVKSNPVQAELVMVTPCSALAETGSRTCSSLARFLTWNDFCAAENLTYVWQRAAASPIPPGFFLFPEYRVLEASGDDNVNQLLADIRRAPDTADLLELLYCQGGCHNGDGV